MRKFKFNDHVKLHDIARTADNIVEELSYAKLLDKKTTLEEREEVIADLKKARNAMNRIEDANAINHYKEGRANGILDGILIGEFLMIGSYGLGKLIGYYLNKRG